MPKELCHWLIARAAARTLDATVTAKTAAAVAACPEAFLVGAVAPDGPFYVTGDARVVAIAGLLHGYGATDAYAPVQRAITSDDAVPAAAIAFAAGVLCHMAADTVFHPAVFYFTGFPTHASVAVQRAYLFRHRAFETAMDLHLLAEQGQGIERRLDRLLVHVRARSEASDLFAAAARYYATSPREAATILERAGKTQRLFFSRTLRLLLRLRHLPHAGRNTDVSALFYADSSSWAARFTSPCPYRDPVTGEHATFDLPGYFARAVARSVSLCESLERALAGDATAFPRPGPSLESGHALDQDQQMRHCDPTLVT